ncbi:MAG: hypothetical protein M5U19_18410 [Microthrixaceae bacterium]|nr:hypothetical protein [Microthrixaceae bacterium]
MRLVWDAPRASRRISDINVHPDACVVLFPVDGVNLAHDTMGSEEHPVQAWHWRAGTDEAFVVTATGVGTTQRHAEHAVEVSAAWDRGRWRVVFTRALQGDGPVFTGGARMPVAFAVWSGVAGERAGLKSVSQSVGSLVVGVDGGHTAEAGGEVDERVRRSRRTRHQLAMVFDLNKWPRMPDLHDRARRSGHVATAWTRCGGTS